MVRHGFSRGAAVRVPSKPPFRFFGLLAPETRVPWTLNPLVVGSIPTRPTNKLEGPAGNRWAPCLFRRRACGRHHGQCRTCCGKKLLPVAAANVGAAPADRARPHFGSNGSSAVRLSMCGSATTCVNSDASNLLNNGHCASRYKAHVWPRLCIRLAGCSFSCSDGARCDTGRQPLTLAAKGALRRSSVVCAKVGGQYPPQGLWQAIAGLLSSGMRVGSVLHVEPRGLWAVLHAGPRFIGRRPSLIRGCRTSFCGNNFHQDKF